MQYGRKKKEPKGLEGFKAREGLSPEETHKKNASNFMNAVWKRIENGDERLIEHMMSSIMKGMPQDLNNPLLGLPELKDLSVEDLKDIESKLEGGEE